MCWIIFRQIIYDKKNSLKIPAEEEKNFFEFHREKYQIKAMSQKNGENKNFPNEINKRKKKSER